MRIIVTGGDDGVGRATAEALAAGGHSVLIGCQDTTRGELVTDEMDGDVVVRRLDLADLSSVRSFADSVDRVDVLLNSAEVRGLPLRRTHAGFEYHFGFNHLGHFALTCLLGDAITDRVVSVTGSTRLAGRVDLDDLNWRRREYSPDAAYEQSKFANALFIDELARRGVRAYIADPGTPVIGVTAAAQTVVAAVTTDLPGGSYLTPRVDQWGRRFGDSDLAQRLWDLSAALTDCDWRGETSMPLLW